MLVGAVADGVKIARLVFKDGSSAELSIDPHAGFVEWVGSLQPEPAEIRASGGRCGLGTFPLGSDDVACDGFS